MVSSVGNVHIARIVDGSWKVTPLPPAVPITFDDRDDWDDWDEPYFESTEHDGELGIVDVDKKIIGDLLDW